MIFPTFDFLIFAIPTLVVFWMLADKPMARTIFLLAASYFFYAAGPKTDPPPAPAYFAGLLVFSTLLDFVCGKKIFELAEHAESEDDAVAKNAQRKRKALLVTSLVGNLGLLAYFKYFNFFIQAFSDAVGMFGLNVAPLHLDVVLPLGISFYTFQSLSYTLDIHKGRLDPEPSFWRFALFVVFFPQLVAGPIVRAKDLLPQLRRGPRFTRENLEAGAFRITRGLAKKVILGDWIAVQLTDKIFDAPQAFTTTELVIALYAYTLQIYADFSGYTDIAIGIGRMLGFKLPENFDRPYQAKDIAEYWRRWHMTLSGWLRDYLFFPLLGRLGARGGYFALWLTFFLVGMWHGATYNFVVYANIHAGAMVFNRWNRVRDRDGPLAKTLIMWTLGFGAFFAIIGALGYFVLLLPLGTALGMAAVFVGLALIVSLLPLSEREGDGWLKTGAHVFLTFNFVVFSRIFFRAKDLDNAREFIGGLASLDFTHGVREGLVTPWIAGALLFGLLWHFTPKKWVDEYLFKLFRKVPGFVLGILFAAFACGLMLLMKSEPRPFIYFNF